MKILKTDTTFGKVPDPEEGGTWTIYATHPRPAASGMSGGSSLSPVIFVWALVPDEAPASSPSEAEIAERVRLLREACIVSAEPLARDAGYMGLARQVDLSGATLRYWVRVAGKWTGDAFAAHERSIRAFAIRQLLERAK